MAQRLDVQYVNFYTAGSSALKVAPAIPLETIQLPKRKKIKRITLHVDVVALAGILLAAVMMVLMAVGVSELISLRQSEVAMATYVNTLTAENEALRAEYEEGIDPEAIEKTALSLGMIPAEQAQRMNIRVEDPSVKLEEKTNNFFGFLTGGPA